MYRRFIMLSFVVSLLLAASRPSTIQGFQRPSSDDVSAPLRPTAMLNAVPGNGSSFDPFSDIKVVAGGDVFAYQDLSQASFGSLASGRIFASVKDLDDFSLFPEESQVLLHVLADGSVPMLMRLADRRIVHMFDGLKGMPVSLLTPIATKGLVVGFIGSNFDDDRTHDEVVILDLNRLSTRVVAKACAVRSQDHAWGQSAVMSADAQLYAIAGGCGGKERVAVYHTNDSQPLWTLDSWDATFSGGRLVFNQDASLLLHVDSVKGEFEVIDTQTGRRLISWKPSNLPLRNIALAGRDVVMVLSDDDREALWRFTVGDARPRIDSSLKAEGWGFLVAAPGFQYIVEWTLLGGSSQALRVIADGTLEFVDRRSATVLWSVPVSQGVSVTSAATPHFYVADNRGDAFQDYSLSESGVRSIPIPLSRKCGGGCEVVRVDLERRLRIDRSEAPATFTLVDMENGRGLARCPIRGQGKARNFTRE